jgi:hypothetical protein
MSEDIQWLRRRVEELESHLETYHHQLEDALERDRDFQLSATWGIVRGSIWLGLFGVLWGGNNLWRQWIGEPGWIAGIVIAIAALILMGLLSVHIERGYEGDLKRLSRLPVWQGLISRKT